METKGIRNAAAGASWQKVVRFQQPDQLRGPFASLRHLPGISKKRGPSPGPC